MTSYSSQNIFEIDSIRFSSNFDSGNLYRIEKTDKRPFEYRIWTTPDNAGEEWESKHSTWFYFTVTGLPPGSTIKLNIMNSSKNGALYRYDMRPVYKSISTNNHWVRIRNPVKYQKDDEGSPLSFEHTIEQTSNTTVSFAFTYPYSYTTLQNELNEYLVHNRDKINHLDNPNCIYYVQELLTNSCDLLRVDLLTITSCEGYSDEHEPLLPDLFPDLITPSSRLLRPHIFPSKEVIFISARVHPGEVPSQYTLKGILDFILDENDLRAKELRKRYVFKIIPMLNPDGVYRGHFRMDQYGKNLNRYYINPDPRLQPTIYAVKVLLNYYSNSIALYLDLHAHASKRGCFIYGNVLDTLETQIQNQLYCKLISLNSPHFDYTGCLFSKEHMSRVDTGDNMTAEGSGRVSTYLNYGIIHSYTLECNYNMSKYQNEISAPIHDPMGKYVTPASNYTTSSEKYTPSVYAGVGRACIIAILDIRGHNPCSRILTSKYKTLERLRFAIISEVKQRLEYRGQVLSTIKKKSYHMIQNNNNNSGGSNNNNNRLRNHDEVELFNWCRKVDYPLTGNDKIEGNEEDTSIDIHQQNNNNNNNNNAWFISSKVKKKSNDLIKRETNNNNSNNNNNSSNQYCNLNEGCQSIFPQISISNDYDDKNVVMKDQNDIIIERRYVKVNEYTNNDIVSISSSSSSNNSNNNHISTSTSSTSNNSNNTIPSSSATTTTTNNNNNNSNDIIPGFKQGFISVPSLSVKYNKRPQPYLRQNIKDRNDSSNIRNGKGNGNGNNNGSNGSNSSRNKTGRDSPAPESILILTGRSVTTNDSNNTNNTNNINNLQSFGQDNFNIDSMQRIEIKSRNGRKYENLIDQQVQINNYSRENNRYNSSNDHNNNGNDHNNGGNNEYITQHSLQFQHKFNLQSDQTTFTAYTTTTTATTTTISTSTGNEFSNNLRDDYIPLCLSKEKSPRRPQSSKGNLPNNSIISSSTRTSSM